MLDHPVAGDADRVFEYCQDPIFERFLTVPWPYYREHADGFLNEYVPSGWMSDREYTWALRDTPGAELLGVIGLRLTGDSVAADASVHRLGSIGFWLGTPHRGRGLMPEAQRLVADWAFSSGIIDVLQWECLLGNVASARAAWKSGFRFSGVRSSVALYRDGSYPDSWQGHLAAGDDRAPQPGWPAEALAP
ncbi:GNAT family N-acetyltransferase [Cryobacterium sp. PH31-L1]|uniref:GNAT family N-acetyltransferase n=1 Tax=Cryobacterium sp. PH31-L1 TaxID=3046199 RepID=UPI0024BB659C|nr:GNAT family N-acetyltransferase [Cryobacterium sp. PH31-L1]MDJ0376343.1 GNAT family N-acetyltransferase [Cryobacterium sp. PH31-L1]